MAALLGLDEGDAAIVRQNLGSQRTAKIFARLIDWTDGDVMPVLAVVMAETLAAGSQVIDTLGAILTVDMAAIWQPDQTFFALLKDRETVSAIFAEVIGTTAANSYLTETGTKKIDHPQSADWRWANQGRNLDPALYVVPSGSLHGAVKGERETSLGVIGSGLMPTHCISVIAHPSRPAGQAAAADAGARTARMAASGP